MATIDKLIFDALAGRRSVALPGAGTLSVKRQGAKKISDTRLIPPHNVVVFAPGEVGEGPGSVVSLVSAAEGVGAEEAVAIYGSWLEGAKREDGSIAIEGVGEMAAGGAFVANEQLDNALNPNKEDIVTMETEKKSTRPWVWIILAIAAAALLLLGGVWCWKDCSKKTAVETVVPAPAPAADSLSDAAPASSEVVPAGPRWHVVAGAFAIESNADKYMERLKREHPELNPEKIIHPGNGYNMVSLIQMPTEREARRKMNLYWDIDLYLWIYEQK